MQPAAVLTGSTGMVTMFALLAVACCGLFAGAALYINVVEHPARMSCGVNVALCEWAPSYKRAAGMQASLAIVGGVAGVVMWAFQGGLGYLVGGLLLLGVVPFTLVVVLPTNKRLLDLHASGEIANAHELLQRWNTLHAVRTALSVAAFVCMLSGLR